MANITKEEMDGPVTHENDIRESFRFIRFINKYGGGHRAIKKALETVLWSWPKNKPVAILDIGCGDGAAAPVIINWGKKQGLNIKYTGVDKNKQVIELAKRKTFSESIEYKVKDLLDPDLPEVDFIIASMVFHHFRDEEIHGALLRLLKKARHGLIINDLIRSFNTYIMCYLLTRFVKNTASRHDAILSVKKGFRLDEIKAIFEELNIDAVIKKIFPGRFLAIMLKS